MTDDNIKPIPFTPRSASDALALEIAQAFKDEIRLPLYRQLCSAHNHSLVFRAFRDTMRIPIFRVKKSRCALFIYLLKKYDQKL
jgi:hypothetical protein